MSLTIDPRARALIFDMDGTIADTMEAHFEAWRDALAAHGLEITRELFFSRLGGRISTEIVRIVNADFGLDLDVDEVSREKDEAYLHHVDQMRPLEPVAALARSAYGRLPLGLATGEQRHIASRVLKATGLEMLFDAFVTSNDVSHHKPHPETFLRCAELLGVDAAACQVFEDSPSGLEAGRRAGMIVTDVTAHV